MHIEMDTSCVTSQGIVESSLADDKAVIKIIQDALKEARDGGYTSPKDIWAEIAATLGITI